jgi:hypothetical protein
MFFAAHTSRGAIRTFVERMWFCSDTVARRKERIVPSGTIELVIDVADDQFWICGAESPHRHRVHSGAIVSGTYPRPFVIDSRHHEAIIGVHFRPGGAYPFLGVPASELVDRHVDLEALWGSVFAREVGLTPKRFSRVVRFQRARAIAATISDPDWAQIALACGYFDQSHMNLDFHALSGLSPTGYVRQRRDDALLNHGPLPEVNSFQERARAPARD